MADGTTTFPSPNGEGWGEGNNQKNRGSEGRKAGCE